MDGEGILKSANEIVHLAPSDRAIDVIKLLNIDEDDDKTSCVNDDANEPTAAAGVVSRVEFFEKRNVGYELYQRTPSRTVCHNNYTLC